MIYSYQGLVPTRLPFRIKLSDGRTRTDPSTFTEEEIADAGYVLVADPPSYDPNAQELSWSGTEWILTDISQEILDARSAINRATYHQAVNAERDRRIALGFLFNGQMFDSRPEDQKRIAGASQLAFMAMIAGAPEGYLHWHQGEEPFAWITQDNGLVTMDAQTVVALGRVAARWESLHIFAARALKDMDLLPEDFTSDAYWPALE